MARAGNINDSDSYNSELGTLGPLSVAKRSPSEAGKSVNVQSVIVKRGDEPLNADAKSALKSQGNLKSEKQSSSKREGHSSLKHVRESGNSSSSSSDLSSSVYSSTISSHLTGDEEQETHHIKDVFAGAEGESV